LKDLSETEGARVIDNPVSIILDLMMVFLVIWVTLALSLSLRDARKRKRLQQARRQDEAPETVPVEQVIRLAEWEMQQRIGESE